MWEGLVLSPRGRLSTRKFVLLLLTIIVSAFTYLFFFGHTTYAADAEWSGDTISYQDRTYEKFDPSSSAKLPGGKTYYKSGPKSGSNVAMMIEFSGDAKKATSATTQNFTVKNGAYTNPSQTHKISITPAANSANTNADNDSATPTDGDSSCKVDGGLGWIICPVTNTLSKAMDTIYKLITGFLYVQPSQTTANDPMYRAWSYMRTIANIAFVIGFMVIIYSQLTSIGLSNYNIKKIIPRVVAAAILVNISYWLCAVAIDISNIIGYSLQDIFIAIRNSLVGDEGNSWKPISWESVGSFIISGGTLGAGITIGGIALTGGAATAVAGGGALGLLYIFLPMLISVLFVVLITFLILAARQALITIFVIISPLAFMAYLLPNTEKWFEKWRSTLFSLLLVFPGFSFIFGGSQLAAAIIIQNAKGANALTMILLAMAVQVMPLAITPLLLRLGGGVLNRVAGIVNNPTKGVFDRGKTWARERSDATRSIGNDALRKRAQTMGYPGKYPSSSRRDLRGKLATAGMRLNPYNMAYARQYDKDKREGMKAAAESSSKALFTQTGAGRAIYQRNQEAHLQQEYGDAVNKEAWTHRVHGNPATGTAPNGYLHNLHHQAHLAEGRVKAIEEADSAHANLQLQQYFNTNPGYRDMKVQAGVDTANAKLHADSIEADAKLQYQTNLSNDRGLKMMQQNTVFAENEAGMIDSIIQKHNQTRWDQLTRTDGRLQNMRLEETRSTDAAKEAEQKWNSLVENIRAKGNERNAAGNLVVRDLVDNSAGLAGSIKSLHESTQVEAKIQENAKYAQNQNMVAAYKSDPALREYAGGVLGQKGATRVQAQATKAFVEETLGAVSTNRSLTSELTRNQLKTMLYDGLDQNGKKVTSEMQQAAMYELVEEKGNNMDVQQIRDALSEKGFAYDEASNKFYEYVRDPEGKVIRDRQNQPIVDPRNEISADEAEERRDWQQMFEQAAGRTSHKLSSYSGNDRSDTKAGNLASTTKFAFMRDALGGKFGPQKFLNMDIDELKILSEDIQDPNGEYSRLTAEQQAFVNAAIEDAVIGVQTTPSMKGSIDDRNRGVMNDILAITNPQYETGQTDNSGRRIFEVAEDNHIVPSGSLENPSRFTAPLRVEFNTDPTRQTYQRRTISD